MSRPAVGVYCRDCLEAGHKCQAQIFVDDGATPLCLPCADDEPCSVRRVGAVRAAEVCTQDVFFGPAAAAVLAVHLTPEEISAPAAHMGRAVIGRVVPPPPVRKVVDVPVRMIGGEPVRMSPHAVMGAEMIQPEKPANGGAGMNKQWSRKAIDERIKEAIIADGNKLSIPELMEKHGVSRSTLDRVLKSAGVKAPRANPERRTGSPEPAKKSKEAAQPPPAKLQRRSIVIDDRAKGGIEKLIELPAEEMIHVEVNLSPAQASGILSRLTGSQKQIALQAVLQSILGA